MKVDIIGAGLVGLATSLTLASRDNDVRVFDPAPASGATHHAGGMLAPAAEVVYRQEPLFPLMLESARLYPQLIELVQQYSDRPTGYRTKGTLVVARDRADATHLTELTEYQNTHGMEVERLTVREARRLEPALSPSIAGAVSIPGDHQVYPRMFAEALIDAAANAGVEFVAESVASLDDPRLDPEAQVLVANGLGGAALYPALQLRPVYGDILRLDIPSHLKPLVTHVVRGFVEDRPVYIIPRIDGTLGIGATSREDDRQIPRVSGIYQLLRDAIEVVPGIEECDFLEATTGARPGTPDDLPYLGRVDDRTVISTGYFRHGILLTALAAQAGADLIESKKPGIDLEHCLPDRFKESS